MIYVQKHPTAYTLANVSNVPQDGYEAMIDEDFAAWKKAELDGGWVPAGRPAPVATAADIKAEAGRRILALAPSWKQSNMIARTVELVRDHGTVVNLWPAEAQTENAAYQAIWDTIKAIRAASDTLEATPPALSELPAAFAALLS